MSLRLLLGPVLIAYFVPTLSSASLWSRMRVQFPEPAPESQNRPSLLRCQQAMSGLRNLSAENFAELNAFRVLARKYQSEREDLQKLKRFLLATRLIPLAPQAADYLEILSQAENSEEERSLDLMLRGHLPNLEWHSADSTHSEDRDRRRALESEIAVYRQVFAWANSGRELAKSVPELSALQGRLLQTESERRQWMAFLENEISSRKAALEQALRAEGLSDAQLQRGHSLLFGWF